MREEKEEKEKVGDGERCSSRDSKTEQEKKKKVEESVRQKKIDARERWYSIPRERLPEKKTNEGCR